MPKHNKKRNTAFLYEMLVREIVKQSISKNKDSRDKVISIIKESFKAGSEIKKELNLFKNLLETDGLSTSSAEKLIQESKKQYNKLDKKKIFKEQSTVIKRINKELTKNVFANFVPNYKDLATLSQIFDDDVTAKKKIMLEENLLNKLTSKDVDDSEKDLQTSNLIVNKFVKKFNDTYSGELHENQKELMNKYILSFADNGADFKYFLNEEIGKLKEKIDKSFQIDEVADDENLKLKMTKVKDILKEFNNKPINKDFLKNILKIQALAKEIEEK